MRSSCIIDDTLRLVEERSTSAEDSERSLDNVDSHSDGEEEEGKSEDREKKLNMYQVSTLSPFLKVHYSVTSFL